MLPLTCCQLATDTLGELSNGFSMRTVFCSCLVALIVTTYHFGCHGLGPPSPLFLVLFVSFYLLPPLLVLLYVQKAPISCDWKIVKSRNLTESLCLIAG